MSETRGNYGGEGEFDLTDSEEMGANRFIHWAF